MKKLVYLIFVLVLSIFSIKTENKAEERVSGQYWPAIKTARYWTSPIIREYQIKYLAETDILIVDVENMFNNYSYLKRIKELNPDLILLCYTNPMEIWVTKYSNRPWQNSVIQEIVDNRQDWLLKKNTKQGRDFTTFWPNMVMINMSASCPRINWRRYSSWMARKLNREVLSDSIWDGYFMDNATPNISWVAPSSIDINNNGQADDDQYIDRSWEKGVRRFLRRIRRANGNDFIIIGNKGDHSFLDILDGKMFENFPNNWLGDTWANGFKQSINNAKNGLEKNIFTINPSEAKFGLTSALLLDNIYLALGQDFYYSPEILSIDLGDPLDKYQREGDIFFREFQKGKVYVFPLERRGEIIVWD